MKNNIYKKLLDIIVTEKDSFEMLISADNNLGLNVSVEEIMNYLEFSNDNNTLNGPIIGNNIITEGDILSVLKIINDLQNYSGEYILYINNDNMGSNTYLVSRANKLYKENGLDLYIKIDYSENYNAYINSLVNLIGSEDFVNTSSIDFVNSNKIIV